MGQVAVTDDFGDDLACLPMLCRGRKKAAGPIMCVRLAQTLPRVTGVHLSHLAPPCSAARHQRKYLISLAPRTATFAVIHSHVHSIDMTMILSSPVPLLPPVSNRYWAVLYLCFPPYRLDTGQSCTLLHPAALHLHAYAMHSMCVYVPCTFAHTICTVCACTCLASPRCVAPPRIRYAQQIP